jgi:DNA mismatch repair protein MSH6
VTYFGSDKKRYQLEVPESKTTKVNHNYQLEGTKKGFKRYSTSETRELLARMISAEDHKRDVLKDLSRRIFEKFSQSHQMWRKAINCVAIVDVLVSLAEFTRLQYGDVCVPSISVAENGSEVRLILKPSA